MATRGLLPGDDRFGPQSPGRFDFTLTFENAIFSIGPMSAFILFAIAYIRRLLQAKTCVKSGLLLPLKLAFATILFGAELAMLALWARMPDSRVQTTLASSILCSIGALFIGAVLYAGHRYSPSPAIPLSIYLSVTLLLDMAKTRSFFLREGIDDIAALSVVTLAAKLAIIVAEEVPKTRYIDKQRFPSLSGEAVGGFWSRSMLVWVNDTLLIGFKRRLEVEDLPPMGPTFSSERLYNEFLPIWRKQNKSSKLALPTAWFRLLSLDIVVTAIPRLCSSGFLLAQPFLLRRLVVAVGQEEISNSVTGGLCGATALVYLGAALSKALYKQLNNRVMAYTRSIVVAALYDKSLRLSHEQLSKSSSLTLMNADVEGIQDSIAMMHDIWASVIEFGLGLFILATFIGPACVLMVFPTLLSTYMVSLTTKRMASAKRIWNEHIETRVGGTSDVLSQLKGVKVSGMGPVMSNHIRALRAAEVKASRKERWARILLHANGFFADIAPPVVVLAGAIFWTRTGGDFSVAEIFTTLSIVIIVTEPLSTVLMFLPAISSGFACSYRVQQFLLLDELPDRSLGSQEVTEKHESSTEAAITIKDVTMKGPDEKTVFHNVNLQIAKDQISMLIGPVGCGKSSLLRCILGEIPLTSGTAIATSEAVAYCDQTPWLQNTSIRNNIVAQSEYSPSWYKEVLHSCALDEDIVQLSAGDQTQVGTGGCNLSGGQRQRVALARAVYSRDPILLLDDVVTALDRRTSKAVLERLLGKQGLFRRLKTSVLMTSSSLNSLTFADTIYAFTDDGSIGKTDRDFSQLSRDSELLKWIGSGQSGRDADEESDEADKEKLSAPGPSTEEDDAARQKGDISLYSYYIKSTGSTLIIAWFVSMAVTAVADRMPLVFLRIWMGKDAQNNLYFIGYALLSLMAIAIPCSTLGVYYLNLVPRSSMVLHERLLRAVMKSRLWYFTRLDSGSVMNRFSSDITIISTTLPKVFMQSVFMFFQIPTDVGIIVAGAKYAAAFVPLLIFAIYCVQFYYLRTSRQMRFLDLEARAPLLTHFSETASGIQHVRAYSWQREFSRNCVEYLDFSQRPHYYLFCIQAWLGLVLDLIIMGIAITVIAFALNYKHTTSEAAVGLSMINIITLSSRMGGFLRSWVEMETSLGAVSRTREFVRSAPVESDPGEGNCEKLAANWPQSGSVELKQVTASYNFEDSSSQAVVRDVSLRINHGDKVGIVGRTGSGKSSLLLTLLNFLDYTGSITIDGKEVNSIPHETLRQRIISISQEGIHLTGSLRKNLDPYDTSDTSANKATDEDLVNMLSRACFWESINSRGYDLDTPLKDIKPSTGQLQLLAVARAMLRCQLSGGKIVLIDEAISNVDDDTANKVQDAMMAAFKACTVVTIAHRLETVEDCGLVVEMEGGRVARVLDRRERGTILCV